MTRQRRPDLDLALPFGEEQERGERKQDRRHGHEMPARQREERLEEAAGARSISAADTASGQPMPGLTP
jgi:hypothetical protein